MSAWKNPPDLFADLLQEEAAKRQRAFALTCLNGVVLRSPVDTGRFRASHIVSVGQEDFSEPSAADRTGAQTMQAGMKAIGGIPKGQLPRIFIQTNLPYARRLENGWSKQAPSGVYAVSFNHAVQVFK